MSVIIVLFIDDSGNYLDSDNPFNKIFGKIDF